MWEKTNISESSTDLATCLTSSPHSTLSPKPSPTSALAKIWKLSDADKVRLNVLAYSRCLSLTIVSFFCQWLNCRLLTHKPLTNSISHQLSASLTHSLSYTDSLTNAKTPFPSRPDCVTRIHSPFSHARQVSMTSRLTQFN